jgi:hypothetical protein
MNDAVAIKQMIGTTMTTPYRLLPRESRSNQRLWHVASSVQADDVRQASRAQIRRGQSTICLLPVDLV